MDSKDYAYSPSIQSAAVTIASLGVFVLTSVTVCSNKSFTPSLGGHCQEGIDCSPDATLLVSSSSGRWNRNMPLGQQWHTKRQTLATWHILYRIECHTVRSDSPDKMFGQILQIKTVQPDSPDKNCSARFSRKNCSATFAISAIRSICNVTGFFLFVCL